MPNFSVTNEDEQASLLEGDLAFLLSLQQPDFEASSFDSCKVDQLEYVNIPTPFGSFSSLDSIMEDMSTFPAFNESSPLASSPWGFGDGFGIDPAMLESDGLLFDMSLDIGKLVL